MAAAQNTEASEAWGMCPLPPREKTKRDFTSRLCIIRTLTQTTLSQATLKALTYLPTSSLNLLHKAEIAKSEYLMIERN